MPAPARVRTRPSADIWPGFVDALATLLLVFIFLLSIFMLAQFYLGQALSGRDAALRALDERVAELSQLLKLEREANVGLRENVAQLSLSLARANARADEGEARAAALAGELQTVREAREAAEAALAEEEALSAEARSEIARLGSNIEALRAELARLEAALEASEERDRESQAVIANLGQRLNAALASKVEELARYRSDFFGRLREALGARADISIVGDRFVLQSEVLFASGSAEIGADGQVQLGRLAETLLEIAREIPPEIDWILRIDGHTDDVPIFNLQYRSNWELSTARAISVARFLIEEGVPPRRLAAAGFAEYHPLDPRRDEIARRRNRRIEFKLTQR